MKIFSFKSNNKIQKISIRIIIKIIIVFFIILPIKPASSQINIIRDAEIESFLHKISLPIINAAGLDSKAIEFYLVNDETINAFVTNGQKIFVNSGLITKFNDPEILIGVLSHEIGHISAGHLAKSFENDKKQQNIAIIGYLMGVAAMIGGSGEVGQASILGANNIMNKMQMKYSRIQEEAADKLALDYLSKIGVSPYGLLKLLEYFDSQTNGIKQEIDEYQLSHPISKKRIDFIKNNNNQNYNKFDNDNKNNHQSILQNNFRNNINFKMQLIKAKIEAFQTNNPQRMLDNQYLFINDKNHPANDYGNAILLYRSGKINNSLIIIDKLIKQYPDNGFFYEMKGEILFYNKDFNNSAMCYNQAINKTKKDKNDLIKIAFSNPIIKISNNMSKKDNQLIDIAITRLNQAKRNEHQNPILLRNLALAYKEQQKMNYYFFNIACYFFAIGEIENAKNNLIKAKNMFQNNTMEYGEIQDLLSQIKKE